MEIGPRLAEIMKLRGARRRALADHLARYGHAVSPQAITQWMAGQANPSLDRLRPIATFLEIDVADLLQPLGAELGQRDPATTPDGTFRIPVYDLRILHRTHKVTLKKATPQGFELLRLNLLNELGVTDPTALHMLILDDNGMAPTLATGDQVLIDAARLAPVRDGIFAIQYQDHVQVRRVAIDPVSQTISVSADNRASPPLTGLDLQSLHLLGRAIWTSRRL